MLDTDIRRLLTAEAGDPFSALRVVDLIARLPRGRSVALPAIVDRLNAEIKKVLERPDNKLDALEPWYMTPEQMAARMKTDYEKYGRIFKIIGTKFD